MKILLALIVAFQIILIGCTSDNGQNNDDKILKLNYHELNFKNYTSKEDVDRAEYYLDSFKIGIGENGVSELKRIISKMPRGSKIEIIPYFEGKIPYPFNISEIIEYSNVYDVSILIPVGK